MITVWFTRNLKNQDPLLAGREAINQALFERAAKNHGVHLTYDFEPDSLDIGTCQNLFQEIVDPFLRELVHVGLTGLVIDYETDEDVQFLDTIETSKQFELACVA
jgi:hypothetical protein